jgi:hypothetical protein
LIDNETAIIAAAALQRNYICAAQLYRAAFLQPACVHAVVRHADGLMGAAVISPSWLGRRVSEFFLPEFFLPVNVQIWNRPHVDVRGAPLTWTPAKGDRRQSRIVQFRDAEHRLSSRECHHAEWP